MPGRPMPTYTLWGVRDARGAAMKAIQIEAFVRQVPEVIGFLQRRTEGCAINRKLFRRELFTIGNPLI
jgi:hypothetical protein